MAQSGPVAAAPGETWLAVQMTLRRLLRRNGRGGGLLTLPAAATSA